MRAVPSLPVAMVQSFDDPEEKPLDPAVERVQRRLRRLGLISGLTLGLGMFAVFGAIVYRLTTGGASAPPPPAAGAAAPAFRLADLGLSPGARLVATALDGDRLALTYAEGAANTVVVIDLATMTVRSRLRLGD